jgi:hypothetical protein
MFGTLWDSGLYASRLLYQSHVDDIPYTFFLSHETILCTLELTCVLESPSPQGASILDLYTSQLRLLTTLCSLTSPISHHEQTRAF